MVFSNPGDGALHGSVENMQWRTTAPFWGLPKTRQDRRDRQKNDLSGTWDGRRHGKNITG